MDNYSIDEILSAVNEIQGRKKDDKKKKLTTNESQRKAKRS